MPEEVTTEKIWTVLQTLVTTVNGLKDDFTSIKGTQQFGISTSVANRLASVEQALDKTVTKLNLVGNMVIRQEEQFEALQDEVKSMKRQKSRPNVIVRGIVEQADETKAMPGGLQSSFVRA